MHAINYIFDKLTKTDYIRCLMNVLNNETIYKKVST